MANRKIGNLKEGVANDEAFTKQQLQTGLASKAGQTQLNDYI